MTQYLPIFPEKCSCRIGFNNRLVLDALRAAEGDKVRIRFNGAMKVIEILPL